MGRRRYRGRHHKRHAGDNELAYMRMYYRVYPYKVACVGAHRRTAWRAW